VGDLDSFIEELGTIVEEPESSTPDLPALVAEFVPLNRRRVRGDPPLSVGELERWMELRELLEYEFGTANPPLAGSRRRQLRVPTYLKVRTSGRGDAVSNLHDVSEGGAFIETSEILEPGAPLKLEIDPGNGEPPLQLDAVVRWGREIGNMDGPAGVGVEFENVEDGDFAVIEGIVDRALDSVGRDDS
jgi:Tfp pilus assembly protein PilZ